MQDLKEHWKSYKLKPTIKPPLKQRHKLARLDWAKSCMKTNFGNVLFTGEVSGNSGWSRWLDEWLATQWYKAIEQDQAETRRWRCNDLGGGIIDNQIVGPFHVPDGVTMCAKSYVDFLKKFPSLE